MSDSSCLVLFLGQWRKELPHLLPAVCLLTSARIQSLQVGYESLLTLSSGSRKLCSLANCSLPIQLLCEGCADDFLCTNQGQSRIIDGVDDAKEMCSTRKAFSLLGDCCRLQVQQVSLTPSLRYALTVWFTLLHCRNERKCPNGPFPNSGSHSSSEQCGG